MNSSWHSVNSHLHWVVPQILFCLNGSVMRYKPVCQRVSTCANFVSPPCTWNKNNRLLLFFAECTLITNTTGPTSPVLLGEPFQLTCSANSTTANFVKQGSATKLGDSHSVQNSSMKDAGTYNCEASSSCKDRSFVVVEVYYGKSMSVEELSIILVVLDNSNTFCLN